MPKTPCPHCATRIKFPDKLLGKVIRCPKCRGAVALPETEVPELPVAAASNEEQVKPIELKSDDTMKRRNHYLNLRHRRIVQVVLAVVLIVVFAAAVYFVANWLFDKLASRHLAIAGIAVLFLVSWIISVMQPKQCVKCYTKVPWTSMPEQRCTGCGAIWKE